MSSERLRGSNAPQSCSRLDVNQNRRDLMLPSLSYRIQLCSHIRNSIFMGNGADSDTRYRLKVLTVPYPGFGSSSRSLPEFKFGRLEADFFGDAEFILQKERSNLAGPVPLLDHGALAANLSVTSEGLLLFLSSAVLTGLIMRGTFPATASIGLDADLFKGSDRSRRFEAVCEEVLLLSYFGTCSLSGFWTSCSAIAAQTLKAAEVAESGVAAVNVISGTNGLLEEQLVVFMVRQGSGNSWWEMWVGWSKGAGGSIIRPSGRDVR